jgi:formyltetrahydrofolate-dependent phosphoribosylglycinamide formyltransferase
MTARLAVLISGNGSNLQAIIDATRTGRLDAQVVVVVSNRKDAFGLIRAEQASIPTRYHPLKPYRDRGQNRQVYDADLADLLAAFKPEWIVLAGWMHIFSNAFLSRFPDRVINLHPALPGQFPGAHAIADAFVAYRRHEIEHTGIMVHLVPDERVDEGPVLATRVVPILPQDSEETLAARIHAAEHTLLVDTLQALITGEFADAGTGSSLPSA